MNVNIYVSYHIPFMKIPCEYFIPIQVGKTLASTKLDMIGDDTGDNISIYNPAFSDVVSQYWAWKNDPGCDYIGFFHYRRFFCFKENPLISNVTENNVIQAFGLDPKTIDDVIKDYDIIVPPAFTIPSLYAATCNPFGSAYADKLISTMKKTKPEFSNAIDKFYAGSRAHLYNLFIMKKELFNEFCEFLFGTLLPLRDEIGDVPPYSTFERFFGYTAEQFINIYIMYLQESRNVKVLELSPVKIAYDNNKYSFSKGSF